jgi:hypothetical protein
MKKILLLLGISIICLTGCVKQRGDQQLGAFGDPFIEIQGGTGTSTYVAGDILYSDSANSLSSLPIGSSNQVLTVSGGLPIWAAASSGTSNWATDTEQYFWNNTSTWTGFQSEFNSKLNATTTTDSDNTWTLHNNYPAACSTGNYVTAIGDTLTCSTPAGGSGGGNFWASTTANSFLYNNPTTYTVLIGSNATSTNLGLDLEVVGDSLFGGNTTNTGVFIVGADGAGDSVIKLKESWVMGLDDSDNDDLVFSSGTALGANNVLKVTTSNILATSTIFTKTTTTNLAILGANAASCDLKATTDGVVYCGTDANSPGTGSNWDWGAASGYIKPSTTVGIIVTASSTFGVLNVGNNLFGAGVTSTINGILNATTTYPGAQAQFNNYLNATTTLDLTTLFSTNITGNLTGNVTGNLTGNADTATALAANPSDCGANTWANVIAANGNLTCAAVTYAGISAMTSANWAGVISDETGTAGKLVFDTSPTISGATLNGLSTIADGRIAIINASSTLIDKATTTSLYTSSLGINSEYFQDLTGAGLQNSTGVLTLNATGDWTGTFDSQEGTWYRSWDNLTSKPATSTILNLLDTQYRIAKLYATSTIADYATSTSLAVADFTATGAINLPANGITDAMVSNTLTCSDLQAASAVVADAEVVDALTLNTSIEAIFTGGLRSNIVNATTTNADNLRIYTLGTFNRSTSTSATTTDYLYIGPDGTEPMGWNFNDGDLFVSDLAYFNNKATTSIAMAIGAGTINNLNMVNGDLYVQDGTEIDGELFVTGAARFSTINATTTIFDNLKVTYATTTSRLIIPSGAAVDIGTTAAIGLDTTSWQFKIATNTTNQLGAVYALPTKERMFNIPSTTMDWREKNMTTIPPFPYGINITGVMCQATGTATSRFDLKFSDGTNNTNTIGCGTTRPTVATTTGANSIFTAGENIIAAYSGKEGTINEINITFLYTITPD